MFLWSIWLPYQYLFSHVLKGEAEQFEVRKCELVKKIGLHNSFFPESLKSNSRSCRLEYLDFHNGTTVGPKSLFSASLNSAVLHSAKIYLLVLEFWKFFRYFSALFKDLLYFLWILEQCAKLLIWSYLMPKTFRNLIYEFSEFSCIASPSNFLQIYLTLWDY